MKVQTKNKLKLVVGIAIVFFSINDLKAQDGAELFKKNCTACHKLEGTLVGPGLKGVQPKWQEAGEAENLIKWVQNPTELYNSGTSEMAKIAWDITPIPMNAQNLTEAEIKAIFEFIEADVVEEKKEEKSDGGVAVVENLNRKPGEPLSGRIYTAEEKVLIKEKNDNRNRMIFFALVLTAICLLLGIVSISKTIQTFSILKMRKKGDETDDKKGNRGVIATVIIALMMLAPFSGNAMGFDFEKDGWLYISNADNFIIFVVNLVLLFILFDQKKTLKTIIRNYDPTLIPQKETAEEGETAESIVKLLTDTVSIEDEASILLDHEFDGIRELDNNMPPWWVWSFVATVIFAFGYLVHYHVTGTGDLQIAEYEKSIAEAQVEVDAYMSKMAMNVDENNVVVLTDAADIQNGKNLYKLNCVVCHKDNGEGLVGPNLTDDYWIYGEGDVKTVFTTIKYGTTNGMPEHESKMNPIELQQVASFILTMEYAEGKAPEGTEAGL